MLLRAGAAHEEAYLRALHRRPASRRERQAFFGAAQLEAALLTNVETRAPATQLGLVRKLEREHTVALTAAARSLLAPASHRIYATALARLRQVQVDAAAAQSDLGIDNVSPWPSTGVERLELGALAIVLLAGILVIARQALRAAGLRRQPRHASEIELLMQAVRSDSLTGLANHRAFQDDFAAAIELRNTTGTIFSLLAFDLDELKRVNDVEGHQAGDAFIKTVAGCIREGLDGRGTVYRTGGDEFMAILPGCRGWEALTAAHKIQQLATERTGKRALSIGLTESAKTEAGRVLLHQADLALYEAKRAKLLAVSYHEGLEPRQLDAADAPSEQQKALAAALARAVDVKDSAVRNHSETVAELCVAMGSRLGIGGEHLERLRIAGLLHDVGKIGVPDTLLSKPGPLAPAERLEIELHATVGHSILVSAGLQQEAEWVLHHHERFDGNGYPAGLAADSIPPESRIIAVADAFEAMTGARSYRQALTPESALAELALHAGTQFDRRSVQALNEVFGGGDLTAARAAGGARLTAIA
jgi:diguanylate cyclase (GGDEF)-like protein/putative nucleotidyltransferase with HDIG domain